MFTYMFISGDTRSGKDRWIHQIIFLNFVYDNNKYSVSQACMYVIVDVTFMKF